MKILFILILTCGLVTAQSDSSPVKIKDLGSYWKHGKVGGDLWHNILVPKNIKKDELIAVAKALFKDRPGYYRFFTDDKEFTAFIASDIHYPSDNYPYPEKWANQHYLAIINKHFGDWALQAQSSSGQKFAASPDSELIVTLGESSKPH